ncbi:MAG TPA: hypothetical protein VHO48_00800 [Anaerolineaceae bacterium]|nr:hypothetical protein [Anaerolineaceae bacterium]
MTAVIALLDLDGVLIRPGGYRAAVEATLQYYIDCMGLKCNPPDSRVMSLFEALGVTSEWDMAPICLAVILDRAAERIGQPLPPLDLSGVLEWVRQHSVEPFSIEYVQAVQDLDRYLTLSVLPGEALLAHFKDGQRVSCFPRLAHQPFVQELFTHTSDPYQADVTSILQQYVLGSENYQRSYDQPPTLQVDSVLVKNDRPLLEADLGACLADLWRAERLHLASFTARPSLPPRDVQESPRGYSPEAEMALGLVGLSDIPLIGYGRLQTLARRRGISPDILMKPAPVQSLAAIYAAWTRREWPALQWAYDLVEAIQRGEPVQNDSGHAAPLPAEIQLHVFEDTVGGMVAGQQAAVILQKIGFQVDLRCWGISAHADKISALASAGATVYPDVNQAMRVAFAGLL